MTGQKLLRSSKFIICFTWVIFKYTQNWENIATLKQKILERAWHVVPAQKVKYNVRTCYQAIKIPFWILDSSRASESSPAKRNATDGFDQKYQLVVLGKSIPW